MTETHNILVRAKAVANKISLSERQKNNALLKMAESLINDCDKILEANNQDVKNAKGVISDVMIDRLRLNKTRIDDMANGIKKVAELPDPTGRVLSETHHKNGMIIKKISVPLGVVAIIYESRPNVTSDAAALTFKSGNVCVLRSGKDAFKSAFAIICALKSGLKASGIDEDYVNLVEDTTRQSSLDLMTASGYIDLLIPRGGKGLIRSCVENATVPIIETGTGICHIYVDKSADFDMALDIIENAKTSRPSVCNAAEVCLVHKDIADKFLPLLSKRLTGSSQKNKVELRGDPRVCRIIDCIPASSTDFDTEFLDYIMAVAVKDNIDDAITHITEHSTHHSECIVTSDSCASDYFTSRIDSAAVYVNASTRFTDGGEFGLGCEMGISTQKLHARGPMGLSELNTYKYIISGNGQIR